MSYNEQSGHFGGVAFNPFDTGLFSIFLVCISSNIREGEKTSVKFSGCVGYDTKKNKWLSCFTSD